VRLAGGHEERVKLVEQRGIGRQVPLDEGAHLLVPGPLRHEPVTGEHAPRVGVGDEDRATSGIEQDGVDRLGPEPGNAEQLLSKPPERDHAHCREPAVEAMEQEPREGLELARLQAMRAGRPHHGRQRGIADGVETVRIEELRGAKPRDRARRAGPRRVLGEHRAQGDLERRPARPPVLRTEPTLERTEETQQTDLDRVRRRPGDRSPVREDEAA
jgi:hypothetical protein